MSERGLSLALPNTFRRYAATYRYWIHPSSCLSSLRPSVDLHLHLSGNVPAAVFSLRSLLFATTRPHCASQRPLDPFAVARAPPRPAHRRDGHLRRLRCRHAGEPVPCFGARGGLGQRQFTADDVGASSARCLKNHFLQTERPRHTKGIALTARMERNQACAGGALEKKSMRSVPFVGHRTFQAGFGAPP
eukprot:6027898-Pleurochrysis_carterae.AAC.4